MIGWSFDVRLVLAAALCGCAPSGPARDTAFYRDHPAERAAKLAACQAGPDRLGADVGCLTARGAVSRRFWRRSKPVQRVATPGAI